MQKFDLANWKISLPVAVRVFSLTLVLIALFTVGTVFNVQSDNASGTDLVDASQITFSLDQDDHSNPNSVSGFNCDHMSACSSVALIGQRADILIVTAATVLPEFANTMVGRSIEPPRFPPKFDLI